MPAKMNFLFKLSRKLSAGTQLGKRVYLVAVLIIIGASIMAAHAVIAAKASSSSTSAITPALKLAYGTLNLEGTDQAVDSVSAAKLLPLWQLMDELNTSSLAAPEEITAVVEEIQMTMSSAQIKAINAMSVNQSDLGISQAGAPSAAGNTTTANSNTQVVSAGAETTLGGDMSAGGPPQDAGGGSMPGGSSQKNTSITKASSTTGTTSLIKQVIQLLESKLQS
jgi:hypothetical protein